MQSLMTEAELNLSKPCEICSCKGGEHVKDEMTGYHCTKCGSHCTLICESDEDEL